MPAPCVFPYLSTGDQPQARKMSDFERWEKRYGASGHFFRHGATGAAPCNKSGSG
jgi:hypothetical protein